MTGQAVLECKDVTQKIVGVLRASGIEAYVSKSEILPTIVALHPDSGLVAVDVVERLEPDAIIRLNRKVAVLRDSLPGVARTPFLRKIVALDATSTTTESLSVEDALDASWLPVPLKGAPDNHLSQMVEQFFTPKLAIDVPIRHPLKDEGAGKRSANRVTLDAEQSQAAQRQVKGVLVISGPPGSGKTLVLAARAKWLATQHPNWRIQVLCYNRMLVPYLETLMWGHANISVKTVGQFTSLLRVRVSLNDEERARRDVATHLSRVKPLFDAVLIDEWQDFFPAWTTLALAAVRPGRGGVVLAGDRNQALYHDSDSWVALSGHEVEHIELQRPYRSTRQILEVTSALSEELEVPTKGLAFEGEPVDLVWAENAEQQAAAVARDILLLLHSGERLPQDVGVLVTRKWVMGRILANMLSQGIPCRSVYANRAEELDLTEPTVKVTTVHSAKGLEFDVVFLVGLEHLPDPNGAEDTERQGRTAYVGATRARDQLILTYSKDNAYLERIRSLPPETLRPWVWPDDYPEVEPWPN